MTLKEYPAFIPGGFYEKGEVITPIDFSDGIYYNKYIDHYKSLVDEGIERFKSIYSSGDISIELVSDIEYDDLTRSQKEAYKLFKDEAPTNGIDSWWGTTVGGYIGYKFAKPITVNKMVIYPYYEDNICKFYECVLEGSNDNLDWTPLGTYYCDKGSSALNHTIHENSFSIANDTPYLYYRVTGKREDYASTSILINALQFYGR